MMSGRRRGGDGGVKGQIRGQGEEGGGETLQNTRGGGWVLRPRSVGEERRG